MYFLRSALLLILPLLASVIAAPLARQDSRGVIVSPANGAIINPGDTFDFSYSARGDYGITSLNYTVFLLTTMPTDFGPSNEFATGHYFGRFAEPNYPGNPNPPNPAPAQLVMPDFSKDPGGFGTGMSDTNGKFYLTVMEEYVTGQGSVGSFISLAVNEIMYNVTSNDSTSAV